MLQPENNCLTGNQPRFAPPVEFDPFSQIGDRRRDQWRGEKEIGIGIQGPIPLIGVNYTNQWDWTLNPNPDFFFASPLVSPPITNLGERIKFDWRGEARLIPGQTVVLGLEHESESLRTDSTGTVDPFFNFTQTTTTAKTGNKAGYVELQSEFAKRFFLVSNVRYDD